VADLTEQQREENRSRQLRKKLRGHAVDIAQGHAVDALERLFQEEPPEWFSAEQAITYRAELGRLRDRIGGCDLARQRRQLHTGLARGRA
jgi:hypothetical protein